MKKLVFSLLIAGGVISQSFALPIQDVAKAAAQLGKAGENIIDAAKGQKSLQVENTTFVNDSKIKVSGDANLGVKANIANHRKVTLKNTTIINKSKIKARNLNAGVDINAK